MTALVPLQVAFWSACERMLYLHSNPWEFDDALTAWGYGLGPCAAQDLVGLDVVLRARTTPATPVLPRMVSEGRLGRKVGWGYYRYPGGGGAVADPLIEDLIHEEAHFAGQVREELDAAALVERLHAAVGDLLRANAEAAVGALHFPVSKLDKL